ncbi:transposase [Duganella sp. sic0402]|uniref:transposase n=1 Tax=Duganella sp. sic0402 TaxID=2854786 RepID=UPI001C451EEF|nr:transposase [Duganella sp. sic0402]MBV7536915.1 transposase [Duganella sp. sic0402]
MNDDYDTPWKEVVTGHFAEFMAFYFPHAHAAIDWSRPHDFLDQELSALSRDAELGRRLLDKLVRVCLLDGSEQWVLLHLEVQGWRDPKFAERIFTYHYRVYDRYFQPVASMAVLADRSRQWRPSSFSYRLLGCELRLDFPVVKLQDYAPHMGALLEDPNPFALVTAAHLLTQQTRHRPHQRRRAKWRLTKLLYQRKWDKRRIIDFFCMIDWLMRLPEPLDTLFQRAIFQLERRETMVYITSVERYGMKLGWKKGLQEGLQEGRGAQLVAQLEKRYGPLDSAVVKRVAGADVRQLAQWALNFVDARSLKEVFGD